MTFSASSGSGRTLLLVVVKNLQRYLVRERTSLLSVLIHILLTALLMKSRIISPTGQYMEVATVACMFRELSEVAF